MTENTTDMTATAVVGLDVAKRNGAAVTVALGAVLAIVGTFFAWITITVSGQSADQSGLDWSGDAKWVIGFAGLAIISVIVEVTGWEIMPWLVRTPIIDGIVMGVLLLIAASQAEKAGNFTDAGQSYRYHRHVGAGLWLSLAGAALVLIGGYTLAGGAKKIKERILTSHAGLATVGPGAMFGKDEKPSDPPSSVSS